MPVHCLCAWCVSGVCLVCFRYFPAAPMHCRCVPCAGGLHRGAAAPAEDRIPCSRSHCIRHHTQHTRGVCCPHARFKPGGSAIEAKRVRLHIRPGGSSSKFTCRPVSHAIITCQALVCVAFLVYFLLAFYALQHEPLLLRSQCWNFWNCRTLVALMYKQHCT